MWRNEDELLALTRRIHRTWLDLLLADNHRSLAAIVIDSEVEALQRGDGYDSLPELYGAIISVPVSFLTLIREDGLVQKLLHDTFLAIFEGYADIPAKDAYIRFRAKLRKPEEDWYNIVQHFITEMSDPNQGLITEKVFNREGRKPIVYNEMKFGSQSEIRIAQEFESRSVLFFPLPLAVRHETGQFYKDHREVDFLVCEKGIWGILEVAYHANRYEKDSEKSSWFKKSGILCVEFFTAERCFNEPAKVVDEFLGILRQHRNR